MGLDAFESSSFLQELHLKARQFFYFYIFPLKNVQNYISFQTFTNLNASRALAKSAKGPKCNFSNIACELYHFVI